MWACLVGLHQQTRTAAGAFCFTPKHALCCAAGPADDPPPQPQQCYTLVLAAHLVRAAGFYAAACPGGFVRTQLYVYAVG